MKKDLKGFALGFIMACLLITPIIAFADTIQVSLNTVNINLNGTQVAAKGQTYTLADGMAVPYSLNYNGTVYLPIRKVSELVGKEIKYDGPSSTINISDGKTETEVMPPVVDPEDTADPEAVVEDKTENSSDNSSNTGNNTAEEKGFVVLNSFAKQLNANGVQVNKAVGFLDGRQFNMLTSKKDLISYAKTAPALYEIKYANNVITGMGLVPPNKEDTVKVNAQGSSIEGINGTYKMASNVSCYEIKTDDDGSFEEYATFSGYVKAGAKIYLYETNGTAGYDIILMKRL